MNEIRHHTGSIEDCVPLVIKFFVAEYLHHVEGDVDPLPGTGCMQTLKSGEPVEGIIEYLMERAIVIHWGCETVEEEEKEDHEGH